LPPQDKAGSAQRRHTEGGELITGEGANDWGRGAEKFVEETENAMGKHPLGGSKTNERRGNGGKLTRKNLQPAGVARKSQKWHTSGAGRKPIENIQLTTHYGKK
jgi:hypothetical protein